MSDYKRCETCGHYDYTRHHTCLPEWKCIIDGEQREARGYYAEAAAEKAAEEYWENGDGCPSEGDTLEVHVTDGERVRKFSVTASYSINYSAEEL